LFADSYYFTLTNNTNDINLFYAQDSVRNNLPLNLFASSAIKLNKIQAQQCIGNSIVVVVSGEMTFGTNAPVSFVQTFVLMSCLEGFYVRNDVLEFVGQVDVFGMMQAMEGEDLKIEAKDEQEEGLIIEVQEGVVPPKEELQVIEEILVVDEVVAPAEDVEIKDEREAEAPPAAKVVDDKNARNKRPNQRQAPRAEKKEGMTLFVSKLPDKTSTEDLNNKFGTFGKIVRVEHGSGKKTAFVSFADEGSVKKSPVKFAHRVKR